MTNNTTTTTHVVETFTTDGKPTSSTPFTNVVDAHRAFLLVNGYTKVRLIERTETINWDEKVLEESNGPTPTDTKLVTQLLDIGVTRQEIQHWFAVHRDQFYFKMEDKTMMTWVNPVHIDSVNRIKNWQDQAKSQLHPKVHIFFVDMRSELIWKWNQPTDTWHAYHGLWVDNNG